MEIAILDFGSQYVFNIKRILLELGVEAEILRYDVPAESLEELKVKGLILSGGPYSVYQKNSPLCDPSILNSKFPILGLCYGHQLIAHLLGGEVRRGEVGEYGFAEVSLDTEDPLFLDLNQNEICWMSHGDIVVSLSKTFRIIASTIESRIAAFHLDAGIFGLQFHPEVSHTPNGRKILKNFAFNICSCSRKEWDVKDFIQESVVKIRDKINGGEAIIAVSGGVDSTTAALLAHKALKKSLYAVHIDHGLMRKGESKAAADMLSSLGLNLVFIDASEKFLNALANIEGSDDKRRIIGKLFIEEFEKAAREKKVDWLIQGTIAPDIIESTRGSGDRRMDRGHGGLIKIHHNVAGLPAGMKLNLVEPISSLFKYQVRTLAREMGLPAEITERQPFPGPGLGCRIAGAVTEEKVSLLREIESIVMPQLKRYNPSQYFAILVNNLIERRSVRSLKIAQNYFDRTFPLEAFILKDKGIGVKGDERVIGRILCLRDRRGRPSIWGEVSWLDILRLQNEITGSIRDVCRVVIILSREFESDAGFGVILRAVDTVDYMTAVPTRIDLAFLTSLSDRLMFNFPDVKFVGYEITTKPPATIELI